MIQSDLRRARVRWIRSTPNPQERRERRRSDFLAVVDDAGQVVDFHALRTTYITLLVKGGVSVKAAQELVRHSDPKLTMNVYTKLGITDLAGALDHLPAVGGGGPKSERLRATGTDDARAEHGVSDEAQDDPRLYPRQLERETSRTVASDCDEAGETRDDARGEIQRGNARKSLSDAKQRDDLRSNTTGERRGRDSNPRYGYEPVRRFSKPVHSATLPPLHVPRALAVGGGPARRPTTQGR